MLHQYAFELKLTIASALGGSVLFADIVTEAKGWEDLSLKAILIVALIYIGRLYLLQQREHKAEMREIWNLHKQDDDTVKAELKEILKANTQGMTDLTTITREQTDYFKTVTRTIVDDRIKSKSPTIP